MAEVGGPALLIVEALEILALRSGASSSEIKEAYRDLVKVWHPDRFGNDVRLRQKAELRLKLINEAYRVLQSNQGAGGMYASGPESVSSSASGNASSSSANERRHAATRVRWSAPSNSSGNWADNRWIYRGLGLFVILLTIYFAIEHDRAQGSASSGDSVAGQPTGTRIPQTPPEALQRGGVVHSRELSDAEIRSREAGRSEGLHQFRVRSLSAAETDRLRTLCSRQKELWGQAVYQSCLKAQLDVMTNPTGKPDVAALSNAERESIESVCYEARQLRGLEGYNRCANIQVAILATEPARPNLSALNDGDRHSIESACTRVKNQEGPAAYNRCLNRLMNTLAAAR